MDVSEKFKEIIGDLVESELSINDGDKIVYFLFEGSNNCLQEIELEDYEEEDSEFFIEEYEPVILGCYFYLPDEKSKLDHYLTNGSFGNWIFPDDDDFIKAFLNYEKELIIIRSGNLEVKYPDSTSDGNYGDLYRKNNDKYFKVEENYDYDYGDDNFTVSTSVEGLIKAVFINSESADKFEFVDLGLDPLDIANYLSELYIT